MGVVADASPINYLALIDELELLKLLYGRVLIPHAVMNELRHPSSPPPLATFASTPPNWIETVEIEVRDPMPDLDPGETAAIALAELYPDSLLLIDEAAGRAEAGRRRIALLALWASCGTPPPPVSSIFGSQSQNYRRPPSGCRPAPWPNFWQEMRLPCHPETSPPSAAWIASATSSTAAWKNWNSRFVPITA